MIPFYQCLTSNDSCEALGFASISVGLLNFPAVFTLGVLLNAIGVQLPEDFMTRYEYYIFFPFVTFLFSFFIGAVIGKFISTVWALLNRLSKK